MADKPNSSDDPRLVGMLFKGASESGACDSGNTQLLLALLVILATELLALIVFLMPQIAIGTKWAVTSALQGKADTHGVTSLTILASVALTIFITVTWRFIGVKDASLEFRRSELYRLAKWWMVAAVGGTVTMAAAAGVLSARADRANEVAEAKLDKDIEANSSLRLQEDDLTKALFSLRQDITGARTAEEFQHACLKIEPVLDRLERINADQRRIWLELQGDDALSRINGALLSRKAEFFRSLRKEVEVANDALRPPGITLPEFMNRKQQIEAEVDDKMKAIQAAVDEIRRLIPPPPPPPK